MERQAESNGDRYWSNGDRYWSNGDRYWSNGEAGIAWCLSPMERQAESKWRQLLVQWRPLLVQWRGRHSMVLESKWRGRHSMVLESNGEAGKAWCLSLMERQHTHQVSLSVGMGICLTHTPS